MQTAQTNYTLETGERFLSIAPAEDALRENFLAIRDNRLWEASPAERYLAPNRRPGKSGPLCDSASLREQSHLNDAEFARQRHARNTATTAPPASLECAGISTDFANNSPEENAAWLFWLAANKPYGPRFPLDFHRHYTCAQTAYLRQHALIRPDEFGHFPIGKHTFQMSAPAEDRAGRCLHCGTHKQEVPVLREPSIPYYAPGERKPICFIKTGTGYFSHNYSSLGLCTRCGKARTRTRVRGSATVPVAVSGVPPGTCTSKPSL